MAFTITIIGSSSATPTSDRHPSAQLVETGRELFLLDCGEGTQMQLRRLRVRMMKIDHIFITHLHGDHFFGLIGLVTSYHLLGRVKPLHIHSVEELSGIIRMQLDASHTTLLYPLVFHPFDPYVNSMIYESSGITVHTLPLDHRIPTCGFLFREKEKRRRILKKAIEGKRIAVTEFSRLIAGDDIYTLDGELVKNEEASIPPDRPLSYAYCTDTAYSEKLVSMIKDVDLLFHEATFLENESALARDKKHSTAAEAARVALLANAGMLLLGHFSARYKELGILLDEARSVFKNSHLAEDGKSFTIHTHDTHR